DECHDADAASLALPPVQRALGPHLLEFALNPADPAADETAVRLDLRLTRPASPDRAFHTLEVRPLPGKSRQKVFHLSQCDLEAALPRPGTSREDIEDQGGPVDDL